MRNKICLALLLAAAAVLRGADSHESRRSWAADNGNADDRIINRGANGKAVTLRRTVVTMMFPHQRHR